MVSWSTRRKIGYLAIVFGTLFVIVFSIFLIWYYEPPTCFDRRKNGDETGVDCGGTCALLCSAEAIKPIVFWQRVFKVSPGIYNAVAYVQNSNVSSEVLRASYIFEVYDSKGVLLVKREGLIRIPPNKKFAVFEGGLSIPSGTPARTVFQFKEPLVWQKSLGTQPDLSVKNARLSRQDSNPRVDAIVQNRSLFDARSVGAVVIVSDEKGNALGVSKTFIDSIPRSSEASIVFTWPEAFEAETGFCKRPADIMLAIDRSGSMDDDAATPPQPLTDVKNAALVFVDELTEDDRAGLVSFGTTATNPPDTRLTTDFSTLKDSIKKIGIVLNGDQNTNIGEGILRAREELQNIFREDGVGKVIVLLTDGIPTHPQKSDDDLYPEKYAGFEAAAAKRDGIDIFTIGLGSRVNNDFLKQVSSGADFHFNAVDSKNLASVYKQIANEICKKGPVVIEIIPLVETR